MNICKIYNKFKDNLIEYNGKTYFFTNDEEIKENDYIYILDNEGINKYIEGYNGDVPYPIDDFKILIDNIYLVKQIKNSNDFTKYSREETTYKIYDERTRFYWYIIKSWCKKVIPLSAINRYK